MEDLLEFKFLLCLGVVCRFGHLFALIALVAATRSGTTTPDFFLLPIYV